MGKSIPNKSRGATPGFGYNYPMNTKQLHLVVGGSYLVIFFAAIFANFFALELAIENPLSVLGENATMFKLGIVAFMVTVVFDVVVAWALYELYKDNILSRLSSYLRVMHAVLMAVAIASLVAIFALDSGDAVLAQIGSFNTMWLMGLFFFGFHLILLAQIVPAPKWIRVMLVAAGVMYIGDTLAQYSFDDYARYADVFLALVAIPSILGEMSLALWFGWKGIRK